MKKPTPLTTSQVKQLLPEIPQWKQKGKEIVRDFKFKDYYQTIAFVNAVAWISNAENHHPDLEVGYNTCRVRYTTHDVGGISLKDLVCAASVEALFK